jgi:hypothetical protein
MGGAAGSRAGTARRELRNLGGSLAILAVIVALAYGLPAVNAALPAARQVATNRPYPLGSGVSVIPPNGAQIDVTKTRPGSTMFLLGAVRYQLVVAEASGTIDDAAGQLRHKITANLGYQVTGTEVPARTAQGVVGRQGGYTSPGRDGRYAVFVVRGVGVEVTIAGVDLELRRALGALTASVASIAFPDRS